MESTLPKQYLLNGSDYFQVFLDKHHRRYGDLGNVSRLVLFLDGKINVTDLENRLNDIPLIPWIVSLRLKISSFFKLPRWQAKQPIPVTVNIHAENNQQIVDCKSLFDRDINPIKDAPLQFDLVHVEGHHAFVLSWNHIFMDARGAEIILERIAKDFEVITFVKSKVPDLSWKERLKEIKTVKDFLIPHVKDGLRLFQAKKIKRKSLYKTIVFDRRETEEIDKVAVAYQVGIAKSSFYLAAVQSAFNKIVDRDIKTTWVPVPQDQRRKGQVGPVVSNQVSFLFYGVPSDKTSMQALVVSLREQMMNQMRARLPNSYHIMMDSMRRFPIWLYRYLVASPTNGALASFFYSDTGNSLDGLEFFFDKPIKNALHYPPNSAYPGLTIIFMRVQGRQQIICGYPDDEKSEQRMTVFVHKLKQNLLTIVS